MIASPQQLFHGPGSLRELPSLVAGKVLIVTDPGIVAAGHVARAVDLLDDVVVLTASTKIPPSPKSLSARILPGR